MFENKKENMKKWKGKFQKQISKLVFLGGFEEKWSFL